MRLYKNSDGVWAGTQADAKKLCGKDYTEVDVPTDKSNLLKFLNLNKVGSVDGQTTAQLEIGEDVPKSALQWFAWAYDKLLMGDLKESKEMMHKALSMTSKQEYK